MPEQVSPEKEATSSAHFNAPWGTWEHNDHARTTPSEKIPLTIHLSADVAKRLKLAAEARKRSAADLAADLLDRHLPRPQTGGPKNSIPYS